MSDSGCIYGFIGAGNMGSALARAARRQIPGDRIMLANRSAEKAEALAEELDAKAVSVRTAAEFAGMLFIGVKPVDLTGLLDEILPALQRRRKAPVLVSMAAGVSLKQLRQSVGTTIPLIRIMPNTPCAVGAGMVLYTPGEGVSEQMLQDFSLAMDGAGRLLEIPEKQMDAGCAISGCGPAFADLFLEALSDGGVACGLKREQASLLAAQTLMGAAKLCLESGRHPAILKDEVCSPGGATIQGVLSLEKNGFRGAVMEAVIAAYEQSAVMGLKELA